MSVDVVVLNCLVNPLLHHEDVNAVEVLSLLLESAVSRGAPGVPRTGTAAGEQLDGPGAKTSDAVGSARGAAVAGHVVVVVALWTWKERDLRGILGRRRGISGRLLLLLFLRCSLIIWRRILLGLLFFLLRWVRWFCCRVHRSVPVRSRLQRFSIGWRRRRRRIGRSRCSCWGILRSGCRWWTIGRLRS